MEGMEVMESGRSNAVASSVGESEEDTRSRRTHPTFKSLREMNVERGLYCSQPLPPKRIIGIMEAH